MIRTLQQQSIPDAARLLAGSMADNPLHQRVFASDAARLEPLLVYCRGGFEMVAEQPILGVTNWFMQRHPAETGTRPEQ